jgi:hypothetical protein
MGSFEVVFDDVEHIARLKTVQVDSVLDLENGDRLGVVVVCQATDRTTCSGSADGKRRMKPEYVTFRIANRGDGADVGERRARHDDGSTTR